MSLTDWWVVVAVLLCIVVALRARRGLPLVTVPSHLPGYDELHRSPEFRAQKARLIRERARGSCEHWFCRRRDDLEAHLVVYDCLYEGRFPYDDEIEILCKARHHGPADQARRRKERTRRERRRVARLARHAVWSR